MLISESASDFKLRFNYKPRQNQGNTLDMALDFFFHKLLFTLPALHQSTRCYTRLNGKRTVFILMHCILPN